MTKAIEFDEIPWPFGGKITDEGKEAAEALQKRFGEKQEVNSDEMIAFLRDEFGVKYPGLQIMFGGVCEMMEAIGFEPKIDDWTDKDGVKRHGWIGWKQKLHT